MAFARVRSSIPVLNYNTRVYCEIYIYFFGDVFFSITYHIKRYNNIYVFCMKCHYISRARPSVRTRRKKKKKKKKSFINRFRTTVRVPYYFVRDSRVYPVRNILYYITYIVQKYKPLTHRPGRRLSSGRNRK